MFSPAQVAAISLECNAVEEEQTRVKEEEEIEEYTDIDAENFGDPNLAPTYAAGIFRYLKEKEVGHHLLLSKMIL